jgi:hypothetical protein
MASTYTANTGIEKIGSGEKAGTWGITTNANFDILDKAINGVEAIALSSTSKTITTTDGSAASEGVNKVFVFSGSPGGTCTVTLAPNDQDKVYLIKNGSDQTVLISQGSGANASLVAGETAWVFSDGAGAAAAVTKQDVSSAPATFSVATDLTVGGTLGVTGETTLATHLNMGDGDIIRLGDSNDLLIYHDAENSYIKNATGALKLATEDSGIAVTIGHTTSETTVADNLTVTGNGSVGGTLGVTGNVTLGALLIMPDVTSAKILVADGTSYQEVAVSGDVTIANTGAVTIAANAIETAMIADAQITTAKLAGSVAVIGMSAKVTVGAGTPTITASVNTSSIADNATGDFTITINTDFSNANYSAVVTAFDDDGTGRNVGDNITEAQAAGTIQIKTYRATPSESSTRGAFDPDGFFIICNPQ